MIRYIFGSTYHNLTRLSHFLTYITDMTQTQDYLATFIFTKMRNYNLKWSGFDTQHGNCTSKHHEKATISWPKSLRSTLIFLPIMLLRDCKKMRKIGRVVPEISQLTWDTAAAKLIFRLTVLCMSELSYSYILLG